MLYLKARVNRVGMTHKNKSGFTVVELMLVLAISAVLALAGFGMIQGQGVKNEFTQASRDFESKIVDVANDTAKGYYPNIGTTAVCSAPLGSDISFSGSGAEQGTSSQCVFAGKAIQFNPDDKSGEMRIVTIAARRFIRNQDRAIVKSMQDLAFNNDLIAADHLDETLSLLHGIEIENITGDESNIRGIVFLSGFAKEAVTNTSVSGAPETKLYVITGSNNNKSDFNTALRNGLNYKSVDDTGVAICLKHSKKAKIFIGTNNQKLSTSVEVVDAC